MADQERVMDMGRPRSPLDAARIGAPLIDRHGMRWWLVGGATADHAYFACGPDRAAAERTSEREGVLSYAELKAVGWPLRIDRP